MRKNGKVVAKSDLPEKTCVVCNRPFTWRKKWERVWDEVTTCSKSCNAKRRAANKPHTTHAAHTPKDVLDLVVHDHDHKSSDEESHAVGPSQDEGDLLVEPKKLSKKQRMRKQQKEAVKLQKQQRRAKRMGDAPESGRKPCDLCAAHVDLLVRCTIDETKVYKMVCGKCWPSSSGGVPDGVSALYPYYTYGGLWKNRNAHLKKRIGSGPKSRNKSEASASSLLEEIAASVTDDEERS